MQGKHCPKLGPGPAARGDDSSNKKVAVCDCESRGLGWVLPSREAPDGYLHKLTGCIVIIMQRLHEDNLVGHVLDVERRLCAASYRRMSLGEGVTLGNGTVLGKGTDLSVPSSDSHNDPALSSEVAGRS